MRIGVISDTHGRLRSEVFSRFDGVERILHAGDVGGPDLLVELEAIAPVTAVWGNTDGFLLRERLKEIERLDVAGRTLVIVHGHQLGSPTPDGLHAAYPDADIVVFGHTHRSTVQRIDNALFLNPGSAGAPRFGMPASLAILEVTGETAAADIIDF